MTRQEFESSLKIGGNSPRLPSAIEMFDWYNRQSFEEEFLLPYDYLVLINPSGDVDRYARWQKKNLGKGEENDSRRAHPHFTIANVTLLNCQQRRLITAVKNAAMRTQARRIDIQGFGRFKGGVIYLKPIQTDFFTTMQEALKKSARSEGLKIHCPSTPHLTILKNLSPEALQRYWAFLEHAHYRGSFVADSIKIIRKPHGTNLSYQEVHTEKFSGLFDSSRNLPNMIQRTLF